MFGKCRVRKGVCSSEILFDSYVFISAIRIVNDFLINLLGSLHCQKKYVMSNFKGVI